jgi:GT2 family glycosyltransferase
MSEIDLSIIIVNWNTRELLHGCLASVYGTVGDGIVLETFVIDNGSTDGSQKMAKEEFPQVRLIENRTNRGFAAANNQALAVMSGKYALLLNSDAVLTENAVSELFRFMETWPQAGMACGQLLNADGSKQNSIAPFPSLLTLTVNLSLLEYLFPKRYPSKRYRHDQPIEIESGVGACLILRRAALDQVGLFDERYFFFFEETDLAMRMRRAGWKIYHVPTARIYHYQGQSAGRNESARIQFYRARYQFLQKWERPAFCRLARAILLARLFVNWLFAAPAVLATLGLHRNLRERWLVYARIIRWHFRGTEGPSRDVPTDP